MNLPENKEEIENENKNIEQENKNNKDEKPIVDIENLVDVSNGGVDFSEYEGNKVAIEGYKVINITTPYDETGKYVEGLKRKVPALKVNTEPVFNLMSKEKGEIPIRASEIFNLAKNSENNWGISTHPNAKTTKFLAKLKLPPGIEGLKQIFGKNVVVKVVENKSGNQFLGFYY